MMVIIWVAVLNCDRTKKKKLGIVEYSLLCNFLWIGIGFVKLLAKKTMLSLKIYKQQCAKLFFYF